jgi:hypothetical protein
MYIQNSVSRNDEVGIERECWSPVWPNRVSGRDKAVQTALLRASEYNRKISRGSGVPEKSPTP